MNYIMEIMMMAYFLSTACIFVGIFWLVRKKAFLSDSIGHSVLLGVVLFYLFFDEIYGWGVYFAAILSGGINVFLVDFLTKKKWFSRDAAIALIMGFFMSLALIFITQFADKVHLDRDAVVFGQLALVVLDRLKFFGYDIGAKALYQTLLVLGVNVLFVSCFYRRLVFQSFDGDFMRDTANYRQSIEFIFMILCSVTVLTALNLTGIILSTAFFITPIAVGFLFVRKKLWHILPLAFVVQGFSLPVGYSFSYWANVSVSASIVATMTVVFFCLFLAQNIFGGKSKSLYE